MSVHQQHMHGVGTNVEYAESHDMNLSLDQASTDMVT